MTAERKLLILGLLRMTERRASIIEYRRAPEPNADAEDTDPHSGSMQLPIEPAGLTKEYAGDVLTKNAGASPVSGNWALHRCVHFSKLNGFEPEVPARAISAGRP